MPLKSPHSEPKKRLQPKTKPCLQCAWAGHADSCQYRHRTLSCERCVELKEVLQCSGVKGNSLSLIVSGISISSTGLYADKDDLDVPTFLKDVYADMMRRNKLEADRERRLDRLEHRVGKALKALGVEGGSDEDAEDGANLQSGSSDNAEEGPVEEGSDAEGEESDGGDEGQESGAVDGEESVDDRSTELSGRGRKNGKDTGKGKAKALTSKGKVKARRKKREQVSQISTYFPHLNSRYGTHELVLVIRGT